MLLRDAVKKIREGGSLPAIVILTGEETYIRTAGIRELTKAAGVVAPEMNVTTFEGRPPMRELKEALARCPFLSPAKVVVLKDTDILSSAASKELSKPLEDAVLDGSTLFIITTPGKLDRKKSYLKSISGSALIVECSPLSADALNRFIVSEAKRRKVHIGKAEAQKLAERTQGDLYAVASELDKLCTIVSGQITSEDIERYTTESEELNMFRIFDTFLAGRHEKGYSELKSLLADDPTPIGFMTFLSNTFRQILVARACRDARFPERRTIDCVCTETGAREWAARKAYERAVRFSASKLRENVRLLADADFGAKQGELVLATDLYGLMERLFAA